MARTDPSSALDSDLARYRLAFTEGHVRERRSHVNGREALLRHAFHVVSGGRLRLPSGRLAACDPLVPLNAVLERVLFAGTYEVDLATADFSRTIDEAIPKPAKTSVAWLRLNISRAAAVRFESAFAGDVRLGVDSGVVAVLSAELLEAEKIAVVGPGTMTGWLPRYHDAFKGPARQLVWPYPAAGDAELIAVQPGDGSYGVYWGFDPDGDVACLAIDLSGLPD